MSIEEYYGTPSRDPVICQFQKTSDGLLLHLTEGNLLITPVSSGILRIRYTLRDDFLHKESMIVCHDRKSGTEYQVCEEDEQICLSTDFITLRVSKATGSLSYYDRDGNLLLSERKREPRFLEETDVVRTKFEHTSDVKLSHGSDGVKGDNENYTTYVDR